MLRNVSRGVPPVDAIVAGALCLASQVEIWAPRAMVGTGSIDGSKPVLAVTAAVGTAALAIRRRTPLLTALLVFGAWGIQGLWTTPTQGLTGLIALTLSAYSVAAHSPRGRATVGGAVAIGGITALARDAADWAFAFAFVATAWAVGFATRRRRGQVGFLNLRATRLEQERDEAVLQERARIARELHDVVSHHVMTTVVQAQAAHARIGDDDAVRRALAAIDEGGRAALDELRALLGVMHCVEDGNGRSPQPSVADLAELVAHARQAGIPVELRTEGDARPLPDGVSLAAYRIVQEALTNVLKHGSSASTTVVLRYESDWIRISVADSGPGSSNGDTGKGHGLIGMHERVSLYGGSLTASERADGGFLVEAAFPTGRPQ